MMKTVSIKVTVVEEGDIISTVNPEDPFASQYWRYYILDGKGGLKEVDHIEASDYQNKPKES